jgi:hypothetical protein
MRNFILIFILVAILSSCGNNSPNSLSIDQSNFKNDFYIDSIIIKDEKLQITYDIDIPIFKSDSIFTSIIQNKVQTHKKQFTHRVAELIAEDSTMLNSVGSFFSASPASIYEDSSITSVCYIFSTYFAGNVHGLTIYTSLNFDRKLKCLIDFENYFTLSSHLDSITMKDLINKAINRPSVGINKIHKMDFSLIKDSISFNFGDYEIASYAEGIIQAHVSRQLLKPYINKVYR